MKPLVQIMLVSAQAAPNLMPALDPEWRPERAILIASAKMQSRAEDLAAVLREAGVASEIVALPDEHNFPAIQQVLLDVAAKREGSSVALNLTGGTKFMALAAQSVASEAGWRMFYVDLDLDEIIWFDDGYPHIALRSPLKLRHYLRAYGFSTPQTIDRPQPNQRRLELIQVLITGIDKLQPAIGSMNYHLQKAEDARCLSFIKPDADPNFDQALRLFIDARILRVNHEKVEIEGSEALAFAKGGWMEHHVFNTVSTLQGPLAIRDKACNLKVMERQTQVENELDVAFLVQNRPFVIECKTSRVDNPKSTKANDQLFKLSEVCRRVGGLGTRSMFVSYRALKDAETKLARALGIEAVSGVELLRLRERIQNWVKH